jgi:hypothetical protein
MTGTTPQLAAPQLANQTERALNNIRDISQRMLEMTINNAAAIRE